jgi:kanamycin kinase
VNLDLLVDRFGAHDAEPIHVGFSGATVVRLHRATERVFYKTGEGVADEADRLEWLSGTGFPCPRLLDRGDDWMLTTELPGRDASHPWGAADRPAVLTAMADGLRQLDSLVACPFPSPFPGPAEAVTHGDYCAPNVFIDPATLRFTGVLDVDALGANDRYVDLAMMYKSLSGNLNPQYGGPPAARSFVKQYGADPDDPRIAYYIDLDNDG